MGFDWLAAKNYKRHYICLNCQKGFKRASEEDMKHSETHDFSDLMTEYYAATTKQDIVKYIQAAHQKMNVICPNCQALMLQVHYNFEVPRQRDTKSWKVLQKTMSSETIIKYDTYIEWHRLELQKVVANSVEFELLKGNFVKLESLKSD
jgi:predicted nucleic acid-binding protein